MLLSWLGRLDLNQRMTESKSVVLPLDDAPIYARQNNPKIAADIKIRKAKKLCVGLLNGVVDGSRTHDLQGHNLAL